MKKLLLSLFLCLAVAGMVSAQSTACVPNPANTAVGLYPKDSLPNGNVGQAYNEVIDFVMPLDTMVDLGPPFGIQQAYFCTFKLVSSANLPTGMNYYCSGTLDPNDASMHTWKVNHTPGVINRGCVRLIGTPENCLPDSSNDSLELQILITVSFTQPTAGNNYGCTPIGGLPATLTTQHFKIKWTIGNCIIAIENVSAESMNFKLAPNPTTSDFHISLDMQANENLNIVVCDMMGREVRTVVNEKVNQGSHTFNVNTDDLTPGIYFVKANVGNTRAITQKLIINH